jgi:hypothetical protein
MNLLGLILIASLSLGIVAVSLGLRSPARGSYVRAEHESSRLRSVRLRSARLRSLRSRWVERAGFARGRDIMVKD